MRAKSGLGIRKEFRPEIGDHLSNWEGAEVLLAVIRHGSLRRAADAMSIPVIVARRRIEDFERQIGARLFLRDGRGTRLTQEGETVFAAVERMEAASLDLVRTRNSLVQSMTGPVRIRVADSVGSFWLAPRLGEFQRAFPNVQIELDCLTPAHEKMRDSDVLLTLGNRAPDPQAARLGRIHMMLFAGPRYIESFGLPAAAEDLPHHRLLQLQGDPCADAVREWFSGLDAEYSPVMTSNASNAHYWAVAQGIGIGPLPTYLYALGCRLVPLAVGLSHASDIWLTCHAESERLPRVRRMVDWMTGAFNPSKFPWFRDEFIHPDRLTDSYSGDPLIKLFDNGSGGVTLKRKQDRVQ